MGCVAPTWLELSRSRRRGRVTNGSFPPLTPSLKVGGMNAVFGFIAFAMATVVITIGGFGPRTRGLALEFIAH